MERILVMGSPGSGKSTFAVRLSAITGIPVVSLDALYWKPGWKPSDAAEFETRVTETIRLPRWIIDGDYTWWGGELRRDRADAVVWFDLPRRTCMAGIMSRIATSYGRVRPEMAVGCPERIDVEFFRYVWTYRRMQRPKLLEYLEGLRADQSLICFTDRAQADRYLANFERGECAEGVH
jgi:adenylate kinase family enzyme